VLQASKGADRKDHWVTHTFSCAFGLGVMSIATPDGIYRETKL